MTSSPQIGASAAGQPGVRFSHWVAAAGCAVAIAAVFQFFGNATRGYIDTSSLFYWWGYQWINPSSETQHGWLILALSAWLLWRNVTGRGAWGVETPAPGAGGDAWPGGAAMIGGLALHAAGFAAQQARLSILGLLVCGWGVLRLGGGRRWGAAAVFPLAFLVFAIPFDPVEIGFRLRLWVVEASRAIAHAMGVPVLQSGTLLTAPDGSYHYDVAGACSGVRSLTAMLALSLVAGVLSFRSWWRRALVLGLCLPLVYLGNVARIVAIVFAAEAGGPKWGDIAHDVMGYGVFAIVLGGVLAGMRVLERLWPEEAEEGVSRVRAEETTAARPRRLGDKAPYLIAGAVVAVATAEMFFLHRLAHLPPRGGAGVALAADGLNPVELPAFLGTDWIGRRAEVTSVEREVLPPDTGFSRRNYVSLEGSRRTVFLSVVLSGRDRSSIHRPELCLVGQGWTILDTTRHAFRFPEAEGFAVVPATVLHVRREVRTPKGKVVVPQLVAYWFVNADRVVASHWRRLATDAWNRLTRARADRWAYVLVQTDADDGEAAALARMQAVLDGTLPAFQRVKGT